MMTAFHLPSIIAIAASMAQLLRGVAMERGLQQAYKQLINKT
jgi:hypothetical protein